MTPLTPQRWQQIDQLFAEALERTLTERIPWIDAACRDDPELRRAVLELLESAGEAEAALGESVSGYAEAVVAEVQTELAREDAAQLPLDGRVGPYRLLHEVGRGGMGAVYLAERADAQFEKRVALKLVKRGMDTDEVLRRFRYERQILAALEHPNIARLYDGGAAEDGRPYLVMEYIEGEPITRSCDERRLSVEARLRLFAQICQAVQFAHRNLVVHRDIKPSNILVGADGTPKLLDFGIAKLLDPAAPGARTRTELRLLTPEYASPEQLQGAPITTATDVYSLGLVLHELLVGRRPDGGAPVRPSAALGREPATTDEVARQRGTTPARLRRRLRGDLDTIVLRALAEDPERRYPSAEQLLADVRRHLDGLPVTARGDSLRYRAAKFARRNRGTVVAASLVLTSLVGGLGAALWQADQAARERDAARQDRARAEEVSTFVLGLFEAADPLGEAGGDTLRVRSMVDRGAERVRRDLAGQPRLQAQMLTVLGRSYVNLGLLPTAQGLLGEAASLASAPEYARERAEATAALADAAFWRGDHAAADSLYAVVAALYRSHGWAPDATYINGFSRWGNSLEVLGRAAEARARHERALEVVRANGMEGSRHHSSALGNLATHYWNLGEMARAEPLYREVIRINREVLGPRHPELATNLNNLASTVQVLGKLDEAEALFREAIPVARQAYGDDHVHLAQFVENLATLLDDHGRHDEALPLYRDALRIKTATLGARNPRVAMLQRSIGLNRHAVGEFAEAEALLRTSVGVFTAEYGPDHFYTLLARISLGRTLTAMGRAEEALPLLRASTAALEATAPEGQVYRVHYARALLAVALAARGDDAAAEPLLLESHRELLERKGPDDRTTREARQHLYRLYLRRGEPQRAAAYREPAA